jgi:hypothetical protein
MPQLIVGRTGICAGCKETKPRAPGHYILVCAHVNDEGNACQDVNIDSESVFRPMAGERAENLKVLLNEIDGWPGEPAAYDLEPPPAS